MDEKDKSRLLIELHAFARITAASSASIHAKKVIDNYHKAQVYVTLNGERSDYEISDMTGVPRRTVTRWVEEFVKHGFAVSLGEAGKKGRLERALFTLEELDLELNLLKKEEKQPKDVTTGGTRR
ncbi:MAG: helix-turn-helix domain-containing protein [Candidatus Bathyarchaeia archaeon]